MKPRVLVVDDERLLRESIARALELEGMAVETAATAAAAVEAFRRAPHDLVVLDLKLPDRSGLAVLEELRPLSPAARIMVITAHGTIESAVEAMKRGAFDFVKKPFELEELLASARNAVGALRLERRLAYHDARDRRLHEGRVVAGTSPAMRALWREVSMIAAQPVPIVLIGGESGSGKSLVARALHYESPRRGGPFVELNAAALPDTLIESELFGHERGAFSDAREPKVGLVEVADGGTLFLDEIGDLAPGPQAKLLSFIESLSFRRLGSTDVRTVDTRIVAATNQDLAALVEERRFRKDLLYRLNAMRLVVPPLRERMEDLPALADHFVAQHAQQFHRRQRRITPAAMKVLAGWRWPGNIRELRAVLQRAVLMHDAEEVEVEHLPAELLAGASDVVPELSAPAAPQALPRLEEVELRYIRAVYDLCNGNKVRAAEILGITRQTLARRLGESE